MAHHDHLGADKVVRGETPHASAEMNVTPLIDVLLVLLVIFMAALNLTQRGVDINLPVETKSANTEVSASQIFLEYTAERRISVNKQDVSIQELGNRLRDIYTTRKDKTLFISGAETLRYSDIIEVVDVAKGAGVESVGVVTTGMRRAAGVPSAN